MKRPVKSGIASLKALGMIVALGAAAHASLPYLPLTGPPGLRLLAMKKPAKTSVKIEAPPAATNTLADLPAKVLPGLTNATSTVVDINSLNVSGMASTDRSLEDTFNASVFALPTPDLLGMTPQMLATYFRPVQFGTNNALAGPFHVGFMPPLPAPEKSSRAEYILK
jgi:hypothetical protein